MSLSLEQIKNQFHHIETCEHVPDECIQWLFQVLMSPYISYSGVWEQSAMILYRIGTGRKESVDLDLDAMVGWICHCLCNIKDDADIPQDWVVKSLKQMDARWACFFQRLTMFVLKKPKAQPDVKQTDIKQAIESRHSSSCEFCTAHLLCPQMCLLDQVSRLFPSTNKAKTQYIAISAGMMSKIRSIAKEIVKENV